MKLRFPVLGVLIALTSGACVQTSFMQTASFQRGYREHVEWYIDKVPPREYVSVGIIELTYPANMALSEVVHAAWKKGREVGCHLIVDRAVHRISSVALPTLARTRLSRDRSCQYNTGAYQPYRASQPAAAYAAQPPPGKREFICGVYSQK